MLLTPLGVLPLEIASALDRSWNVDTGGDFTDATKWNDSSVPQANDKAIFARGTSAAYTVSFDRSGFGRLHNTRQLRIGANDVTFNTALGSGYSISSTDPSYTAGQGLIVGMSATDVAVLTTNLTSLTMSAATVGFAIGSNGTLNVVDGGRLVVNGDGNDTFVIGSNGTGTLMVSGGADVQVSQFPSGTRIGNLGPSHGTVTVTGAGSTLQSSVQIGWQGTGTLKVLDGGEVASHDSRIGAIGSGHGEALISGMGSIWASSSLYVGERGTGTLSATDGGQVSSHLARIGEEAGSSGQVSISGSDSKWTSGFLYAGLFGSGSVSITSAGRVESDGAFVGAGTGGVGSILVDGAGSEWSVSGTLRVGGDGLGTVTVTNDGVVTAETIIAPFGQLRGDGTVVGSVTNNGVVAPGNSPGTLHVDGDYSQSALGSLQLELASTISYDKLAATGEMALSGALHIALIGDYVPSWGQSFDLLDFDEMSGAFTSIYLPDLDGSLGWNMTDLYTTGTISVSLTGDFNADGRVDVADYTVWRDNLGTAFKLGGAGNEAGESAGVVDQADYALWKANFQAVVDSESEIGSAAATIPEPCSLILAAAVAVAPLIRCPQKSSAAPARNRAGGSPRSLRPTCRM